MKRNWGSELVAGRKYHPVHPRQQDLGGFVEWLQSSPVAPALARIGIAVGRSMDPRWGILSIRIRKHRKHAQIFELQAGRPTLGN